MDADVDTSKNASTRDIAGYRLIGLWFVLLVAVLVAMGYVTITTAQRYRLDTIQRHQARMDPDATEPGFTPAEATLAPDAHPSEVHVGMYLNRIVDLSIQDDEWTADFYIWFNWNDGSLQPGETFEVVDGQITSRVKVDEYVNGVQHYTVYRVVADITKFFDVSRFPLDDHLLTVEIEDGARQYDKLRYVADEQDSTVSSRVAIPGFAIYRAGCVVKPHSYKSTFGDPRVASGTMDTYSQFRFGVWVRRHDWEMYLKVFLGLTAAVCVALVAFFIKPSHMDSRFSVRVGAFFGAIANTIATSSLIPDTSVFTLTDMVNGVALIIIFLSLVEATISLHMYHTKGEESLAPLLDRVSLPVLTIGFVVISLAIPLSANI